MPSSAGVSAVLADIVSPRSSDARTPSRVIKSDGSVQPFDRNKLLVGLRRATSKRDIDLSELNASSMISSASFEAER